MNQVKDKKDSSTRKLIRKSIRELLAVSFWLHAFYITKFIPLPQLANPNLPRYLYNASVIVFIVNCSAFTDKGWGSVIVDLLYIYFWPFIRGGVTVWKIIKYFYRHVKTKTVVVRPDLIVPKTASVVPEEPPKVDQPTKEESQSAFSPLRILGRMFTTFAVLWASLILTVDYRPFLVPAVVIALIGAGRAVYILWDLLSDRPVWVSRVREAISTVIKKQIQQIFDWNGIASQEEVTKAANSLRLYQSVLNFVADNRTIFARWAFFFATALSIPFYLYISFLFSCFYFGVGKIQGLRFPWHTALIDSLYIPFAWSNLPDNMTIRAVAGLHAIVISLLGWNLFAKHLGDRLQRMTTAAVELRVPLQEDLVIAKLEKIKSVATTDGSQGPEMNVRV